MYNPHRGLGPASGNARLNELLDGIRAEFENQARASGEYEHNIAAQIQEMQLVREKVYQMEQTHIALKAKYDEEIQRLHRELEARGGAPRPAGIAGPPQHPGPSQQAPPSIGHGPRDLFGGIMAGGQNGPGLAPPPPQQQDQQGPPQHAMPQPLPASKDHHLLPSLGSVLGILDPRPMDMPDSLPSPRRLQARKTSVSTVVLADRPRRNLTSPSRTRTPGFSTGWTRSS